MAGPKAVTIKLPETVPIGSQLYRVVLVKHMPDDAACDRGPHKTIWVEDNPENARDLVLKWWHEIFHCGEREYGYHLKDKDWDSDIDRIAQVATQALFALVEAA